MWSFQVGLGTALHSSRLQVLATSSLCPSSLILRTSPLGCGACCHDLERISKKPLALEKASMGAEWGGGEWWPGWFAGPFAAPSWKPSLDSGA